MEYPHNGYLNELINFSISGLIYQVEAIKFGTTAGLHMLLNKPALQLINYTHTDPLADFSLSSHLQKLFWPFFL